MNNVHLYSSALSTIYDKLDIVRRYGEDVSEYEERIDAIIEKGKSIGSINPSSSAAVQVLKDDTKYTEILKELRQIEKELDEYTKYLVVYFKNKSLENEISRGVQIDKASTGSYITEMSSLLRDVRDVNFKSLSKGSELVTSVYKTAYEIIKIELIQRGESKLLNKMVKDQIGLEFINDFVREDLEDIDLDDEENSDIKRRIDELSIEGINYNYADERLILSILLKTDPRILDNINCTIDRLKEEMDAQAKVKRTLNDNRIDVCKERNNRDKNYKVNRIKSITLLITMLASFGAYKFTNAAAKIHYTDKQYMTTREVYDTISGETRSTEELEYKSGSNEVIVRKYGEVNNSGRRTLKKYESNPSNEEVKDIEEYAHIDSSTQASSSDRVNYSMAEQLSKDEYTIVETKTYSEEPTIDFDEESYNKFITNSLYIICALEGIEALNLLRYLCITISNKRKRKKCDSEIKTLDAMDEELISDKEKIEDQIKELYRLKTDCISKEVTIDEYSTKVYRKKIGKKKKKNK